MILNKLASDFGMKPEDIMKIDEQEQKVNSKLKPKKK